MKLFPFLALVVGTSSLVPSWTFGQLAFSGSGTGSIPDGGPNGPADWGPPLQVGFNVSGLNAPIADVSVSITMQHGYVGDLEVSLIPPASAGVNPFIIFSRIGQPDGPRGAGSPGSFSADVDGNDPATYVFKDSAAGNLWSAAGFNTSTGTSDFSNLANIPPGSYRTSAAGPWDAVTNPNAGQVTSFATDSGVVGLTPAQAVGTWILQFRDGFEQDTGVVTDASLAITAVPEPARYALLTGVALVAIAGYRVRKRK